MLAQSSLDYNLFSAYKERKFYPHLLLQSQMNLEKKKGEGNPQTILEAMTPYFLLFFWKEKKKGRDWHKYTLS